MLNVKNGSKIFIKMENFKFKGEEKIKTSKPILIWRRDYNLNVQDLDKNYHAHDTKNFYLTICIFLISQ